jgi:glycosyltransferase involved in cell wall biosynthesis
MNQPLVSVIIPLYNDPRIGPALDALLAQTYPPDAYEILVVDNGSQDDSMALAETYSQAHPGRVRVLSEHRQRGSYTARNAGLAAATGEIIAFTDSDCIPAPDWLAAGVRQLESKPNVGLVAGRVELFARDPQQPTLAEQYELITAFNQQWNVTREHFGVTANLFTYVTVITAVGSFDPLLQSGGDIEWGQRVYRAGYEQLYADEVVVRHPARRTVAELVKKVVRTTSGGYDLTVRYGLKRQGFLYLAKWLLIPPYKKLMQIMRYPGLTAVTRVRLIFLRMMLHYVHLWTVLRRRIGWSVL